VHPKPQKPTVRIASTTGSVHLGHVDTGGVIANIHKTRAALQSMVEQRWFEKESSLVFDFVSHFASVDDWLRHREARRSTSIVPPALIDQARKVLSEEPGGELLVSERELATRFRRRDPFARVHRLSTW
jgi:hypothetical protein